MSTNRLMTRSRNAAQHPGLLIPKQARRSSDEVAAERKAKEDAKKEKERTKKVGIKRVAAFEKKQADDDAMEQTPKVVTKPRPLVRTRSYADVLRASCDDMYMDKVDEQSAEPDSAFEVAIVEDGQGQTTESADETAVEQARPRKKAKTNKKGGKARAPTVRDAIKAVQETAEKTHKRKKTAESSDNESMEINMTPKPRKNRNIRTPSTDSEEDMPAAPPKRCVVRPAATDEGGDLEDLPSKMKGTKENKGKGKEMPAGKSKARNDGADQIRRNVPKSVTTSHLIRIHHLSHVFTNIERNHALLLLP